MKKTLGHWILDVAKYITTAGIIAPFISRGTQWFWVLVMFAVVLVLVIVGLFLVGTENEQPKKRRKSL